MNSRIYTGTLRHARLEPLEHRFDYPVYFFCLDLAEIDTLEKQIPFFKHNRFGIFSFYDADYLARSPETLREKVRRQLKTMGIEDRADRVELVTCARYFGHVFNPASFFYGYNADGTLAWFLTQVNNTFDETHVYAFERPSPRGDGFYSARTPKEFHVSPFFDRKGEYEFRFRLPREQADIHVNLFRESRPALLARMDGNARPFTARQLLKTALQFPLSAFLALPRIHLHAAKLFLQKKLPYYSKPVPKSAMTIRTALPRGLEIPAMRAVLAVFARIHKGRLTLIFPDQSRRTFGGGEPGIEAALTMNHYRFFRRLIWDAGIGLGEGYMAEDWQTSDLEAVLRLLIDNKPWLEKQSVFFEIVSRLRNRLSHLTRSNTLKNSRRNIRDHYDLGNQFFKLFLDETMTYSAAVFSAPEEDLAAAQRRKLSMMVEKARIGPDDHVLEVGSGWGSFAIEAVRATGCRVTGLTLSEEQLKYATERVAAGGLQDRIEFKLCDYRAMTGEFDRIVSIEMLEAVGHEFLGDYFHTLDRLLKPGGLAVIQVITIPDQRYESYRRGCDFIQKHIFPGGHLPSLKALTEAITHRSGFFVEHLENIGPHYAETLRRWREALKQNEGQALSLGFSVSQLRAWEYYFAYCEAGFAARYLNDLHLVLTRPGNRSLDQKGIYVSDAKTGAA